MVNNVIFNLYLLSSEDKNIINRYIKKPEIFLAKETDRFELYSFKNNDFSFEAYFPVLTDLDYFRSYKEKEYVLIESINDFYRFINKTVIYELW